MQKYLLLTAMFVLAIFTTTQAQNLNHRSTISVTAGANIFQILGKIDNVGENNASVDAKGTASYGLTYDYAVKKWFSIGVGGAYNKFSFSAQDYSGTTEDGRDYVADIDLKLSRINAGIRPLFHYANGGRLDLYSGFRLGVNVWNIDLQSDDPNLEANDINKRLRGNTATVNFQFIPFGLRGYITENIGLGFELAFGAPHYAALQLNYRM